MRAQSIQSDAPLLMMPPTDYYTKFPFGKTIQGVFGFTPTNEKELEDRKVTTCIHKGETFSVQIHQINARVTAFFLESADKNIRYLFSDGKLSDIMFGDSTDPYADNGSVEFIKSKRGYFIWGTAQALKRYFPNDNLEQYAKDEYSELELADLDGDGDIDMVTSSNNQKTGGVHRRISQNPNRIANNTMFIPLPKHRETAPTQ